MEITSTDDRLTGGPQPIDPQAASITAALSATLFQGHLRAVYERTDRMFAVLMGAQWIAGIVFALWVSPRAWAGTASQTHVHVWAAVFLGSAISLVPAALGLLRPGMASTRYTIATAQMLMGALLIHLTGGRIETHFHVFGSLAFLAFYRDWRVLVPATIVVAVDHALRGLFWPQSVYGVLVTSHWRWVEHAAWVLFENVFLIMSCQHSVQGMRQTAERTAVLEQAHKNQARHALELSELVERLRVTQHEAEAATRAKSEFVANMSHELRTPLNAVLLYSEMLEEDAQAQGRESDVADLTRIRSAGKHLLGLIDGILDLSKIEAGKMELHLETFDVRRMIEELISTIAAVVRRNGNVLTVTFGDDLGVMQADLTRTRQILFNLLSNAAKFTSRGTVSLHTARRGADQGRGDRGRAGIAREDEGDWIEFTVTDTGIGLTEDQRARLFRPFAQADSSISRKYGGTGLGLALVWRFCQLMGGDVGVESAEGRGARFTVRLPARVADPADRVATPAA